VDLIRLAKEHPLNLSNVDEKAFAVGRDCPFPMAEVELAPGVRLHYLHPATAIPYLFHHPSLHAHMWRRPKARWQAWGEEAGPGVDRAEKQRVYGHPFTCDRALEALRRMPAGRRHVLIMLLLFKVILLVILGGSFGDIGRHAWKHPWVRWSVHMALDSMLLPIP